MMIKDTRASISLMRITNYVYKLKNEMSSFRDARLTANMGKDIHVTRKTNLTIKFSEGNPKVKIFE